MTYRHCWRQINIINSVTIPQRWFCCGIPGHSASDETSGGCRSPSWRSRYAADLHWRPGHWGDHTDLYEGLLSAINRTITPHVSQGAGHFRHKTLRPQDILAPRHFGTTKSVPKFKPNHRWSCVSSELSWVEVSRLFLDHGTRVKVSRTTFLVSKRLEIGAEVSQSVLMPMCLVAEVSGNQLTSSIHFSVLTHTIWNLSIKTSSTNLPTGFMKKF